MFHLYWVLFILSREHPSPLSMPLPMLCPMPKRLSFFILPLGTPLSSSFSSEDKMPLPISHLLIPFPHDFLYILYLLICIAQYDVNSLRADAAAFFLCCSPCLSQRCSESGREIEELSQGEGVGAVLPLLFEFFCV